MITECFFCFLERIILFIRNGALGIIPHMLNLRGL